MDIATAFFNVRGYQLVADHLKGLGSLRLLLGAEPASGEDLGLKPRLAALQAALRGDLDAEPFRPETVALIEDLIRFLRHDRVQVRLYTGGFLHAKCCLFYGNPKGAPLFERFRPVLGIVGSANFTGPGLTSNRELNLVHMGIIPEDEVNDERGRKAALSHYAGHAAGEAEQASDPYEGGRAPKVSRRINFESRRIIKAEVGAAAIWDLADWYEHQWWQGRDFKEELIGLLDTTRKKRKTSQPRCGGPARGMAKSRPIPRHRPCLPAHKPEAPAPGPVPALALRACVPAPMTSSASATPSTRTSAPWRRFTTWSSPSSRRTTRSCSACATCW
jgi:hypothetical protein